MLLQQFGEQSERVATTLVLLALLSEIIERQSTFARMDDYDMSCEVGSLATC